MAAAREHAPDLVLLDVDMPGMSGFDVCHAMKADAGLCRIPVIFLTGSGSAEDKDRGLDLGAVDYVTKPFDAFELRARVRAALRTKHLQDMLIEHANVDPLTELPNRRALLERLAHEWSRAQRYDTSLSFIMLDIDHFKRVNDTFGHQVGDRVLQAVAKLLAAGSRDVDFPARYGGEEFALLVPQRSADSAAVLAERCRKGIEDASVRTGQSQVRVTASFGVADTTCATSSEDLIRAADAALYRGKDVGRNRVELATHAQKFS